MRRVLVTGVSRGIGRAVAEMLLSEGWSVEGISRTDPAIVAEGFWWRQWDVSTPMWTLNGPYEALIHCAAIRGPHGPLIENDPAAWIEAVNTNLLGTYRVVRAALPALQQSEDGRILLFSGGGAFNASPEYSAYATAKGGVISLMETLAEELKGTRVTCNAVAPGPIPTTIHGDNPLPDDGGAAMNTAVECVRHLLSPEARGLTGKTVSAVWDMWHEIDQTNVQAINDAPDGTRMRRYIHTTSDQRRVVA